ncbi:MAG TPA: glycine cleavage system protein GcvH [Planctomycetota bacterium]|jgi:glycine cleavage system H protein|nr:glycine cleavage system protein GcvH [Planctomycetota bacterium]
MRPDDRKYLETHEWAKINGDIALIGITDFAINELCSGNEGDLVYCDLPETGRTLEVGETFGEIESVKAVADLNSPVEGEVIEVNEAIEDHLEILSSDPWEQGWMVKVKLSKKTMDHLIDAEAYEALLASQS